MRQACWPLNHVLKPKEILAMWRKKKKNASVSFIQTCSEIQHNYSLLVKSYDRDLCWCTIYWNFYPKWFPRILSDNCFVHEVVNCHKNQTFLVIVCLILSYPGSSNGPTWLLFPEQTNLLSFIIIRLISSNIFNLIIYTMKELILCLTQFVKFTHLSVMYMSDLYGPFNVSITCTYTIWLSFKVCGTQ